MRAIENIVITFIIVVLIEFVMALIVTVNTDIFSFDSHRTIMHSIIHILHLVYDCYFCPCS